MADIHSAAIRSYNMSRIRGKNTKPEMLVRRFLHTHGFRYRLHVKDMPGKPDIVLPKYKTVILVNGCFWHMHEGCKFAAIPQTNTDYWTSKLKGNISKDKKHIHDLTKENWNIIIIWTCELKKKNIDATLNQLLNVLH